MPLYRLGQPAPEPLERPPEFVSWPFVAEATADSDDSEADSAWDCSLGSSPTASTGEPGPSGLEIEGAAVFEASVSLRGTGAFSKRFSRSNS